MEMKPYSEQVYVTNEVTSVSWFQVHTELSIQTIEDTGVPKYAEILEVGGSASRLVNDLLDRQFTNISVLDISASALNVAREARAPCIGGWLDLGRYCDLSITIKSF